MENYKIPVSLEETSNSEAIIILALLVLGHYDRGDAHVTMTDKKAIAALSDACFDNHIMLKPLKCIKQKSRLYISGSKVLSVIMAKQALIPCIDDYSSWGRERRIPKHWLEAKYEARLKICKIIQDLFGSKTDDQYSNDVEIKFGAPRSAICESLTKLFASIDAYKGTRYNIGHKPVSIITTSLVASDILDLL